MTQTIGMTEDRFLEIVAAFGADAGRWPAAERAACEALCAVSATARHARADAQALDDALLGDKVVPSKELEARILSDFRMKPGQKLVRGRSWLGAGAIAASLAVSLTAGWLVLRPHPATVDLSDQASWEVLGDDLEFAAIPEHKTVR